MIKKILAFLFILWILSGLSTSNAENNDLFHEGDVPQQNISDSLRWSINVLDKILNSGGEWYLTDPVYIKPFKGILNYAENPPVDTLVARMNKILENRNLMYFFDRRPQDVKDLRNIKGFLSEQEILKRLENLQKRIEDSLEMLNIPVPKEIIEKGASKAPVISNESAASILEKENDLPLVFKNNFFGQLKKSYAPDSSSLINDSVKSLIFESCRKSYNDSIINLWRSIAIVNYRNQYIAKISKTLIEREKKRIEKFNLKLLTDYNDRLVSNMNDSVKYALKYLTRHAENDSVLLRLYNSSGDKSEIWTSNQVIKPIRMYLKNPQNDSISVVLINNGKGSLKMVIDDGVILTRLRQFQNKEIKFQFVEPDRKLQKFEIKKPEALPWTLIGYGSVGFTQTALSNWAKGGESSLALLMIGKYQANYSRKKLRWENNFETRYGINQTKTKGFQKNDDKIELQSRFGYSAFKKWFYSGEANFKTQMAPGYKFPDMKNPISAFISPGYLTFSIGLDYKPNKNFSFFLSPISSKTTFVNDTSIIKATNYGLEPGTKRLWEPGLIIKSSWRKKIAENINYDTKEEFFNNYRQAFRKFSFDWEQTLTMQVNHYINVMVMSELIYDFNVKFPVYDDTGKEISRKPKWQFKELFNIGFNYKF